MRSAEHNAMKRLLALEDIVFRLVPGTPEYEAEEALLGLARKLEAELMLKKSRDVDVVAFKLRRVADALENGCTTANDDELKSWWAVVQADMTRNEGRA